MTSKGAPTRAAVPIVTSISPLTVGTDAWLVDIWGVMHNGVSPFVDAARACSTFRRIGGTVILLSNAPRPAASAAEQLRRIGVPESAFDAILTSGDAARAMISKLAGKSVFHLGPERDLPLYDGLGVKLSPLAEAAALVCTGLYDDEVETPDTYRDLLADAVARGLPMICANPDLKVDRGGKMVWCAGGVAAAFTELGGKVTYAGKPYGPMYDLALLLLKELRGKKVPKERVLAIGDGIKTDIAGAVDAGIRAVFVASALHVSGALDAKTLEALFKDTASVPVAAMTSLVW